MDTILRPTAPSAWEIISTEGAVLGALERRPEGFVIAPSISTLLAEDQTILTTERLGYGPAFLSSSVAPTSGSRRHWPSRSEISVT
jgi:hypothetical protein